MNSLPVLRKSALKAGKRIEDAHSNAGGRKPDPVKQALYDADPDVLAYRAAVKRLEREWHVLHGRNCGDA